MTERTSYRLKGQIPGLVKAFWIFSIVKLLSQAIRKRFKKYLFFIDIRLRL